VDGEDTEWWRRRTRVVSVRAVAGTRAIEFEISHSVTLPADPAGTGRRSAGQRARAELRSTGPPRVPVRAPNRAVVSEAVIRRTLALLAVASSVALGVAACDTNDGRELRPAGPDQTASMVNPTTTSSTTGAVNPSDAGAGPGAGVGEGGLTLRAPWEDEGPIDPRYTCAAHGGKAGTGLSPALDWSGVPAGTNNLAIVVTDLTANGFVHWAVVGIDPASTGVADGQAPAGGIAGKNGFGQNGWGGPCPPVGSGEHEYLFQVYALDKDLGLAPGFDPGPAQDQIESASTAAVSLVGRFERTSSQTASSVAPSTVATTTAPTVTHGPSPT